MINGFPNGYFYSGSMSALPPVSTSSLIKYMTYSASANDIFLRSSLLTGTFGRQLMDERQLASKGSNSSRKFGKWPVGGSTIDHSTKFWSRMVSMSKIHLIS